MQNSPYFCVSKARAVKQKVWNEARALRARKTLTPRFTDFFTDFEKNRLFCSLLTIDCLYFGNEKITTVT